MYNTMSSNPKLMNCTVCGNRGANGAIASIALTTPELVNCLVVGNTASSRGAGMFNYNGSLATLDNCTFSGNSAFTGGGISNVDGSTRQTIALLNNCILWGNSADSGTDEAAQISSGVITPSLDYSCVQGWTGSLGGEGNIGLDPLFTASPVSSWTGDATYDPATVQTTFTDENATWGVNELSGKFLNPDVTQALQSAIVGNTATTVTVWGDFAWLGTVTAQYRVTDYRLPSGSPCVDAGDNEAVPSDTHDLDGDGITDEPIPADLAGSPRFVDDVATTDTGKGTPPIVDMGALEYPSADFDGNGNVDLDDFTTLGRCLAGSDEPVPPAGCHQTDFANGDLDGDNDVDLADFAVFQEAFTGP